MLLDELIDCGVTASLAFVDFLHEELL